ncbi:MAG: hypothetical protein QOF01_3153 [Thermomicrobiales bacterium]|jgi:hypothetical protein|nr:hypothetical protein [Thermomicrobiales bacterium]MEA2527045.1 hypothetical protein [Thermomicrobiales bacterium]MEA2530809.1 hypothetical protein [Thermomicrobiales bacterium]MEA2596684.1 hypothetical protein [Thermomicrobiales bacterium]
MSREEKEQERKRVRAQKEAERRAREQRDRLELLRTTKGSDQWAKVMARQVMEEAIRGGLDPAAAAQRAVEVEAGLKEGQQRSREKLLVS